MDDEEVTRRVIRLMNHLGGAQEWGWRSRVAERLELAPQDVTMILNGKRRVAIGRAVKLAGRAGVDPRYFTDSIEDPRHLSNDASDETLTLRFRALIDDLGRRLDRRHGWKSRVAEQLGIYPAEVPKILGGTRRIGWAAAAKACARLGLDQRFFTDTEERYTQWLSVPAVSSSDPMVEREARVMSDLLLLDEVTRKRVLVWANARW